MAPVLSRHPSTRLHRTRASLDSTVRLDQSDVSGSSSTISHSTKLSRRPSKEISKASPPINTIAYAYMICSIGGDPSQWVEAPLPSQGKVDHMNKALNHFWLPEILASSPKLEQDDELARSLHSAMRSCFPHDVEICTGERPPDCVHHPFVIQQDPSRSMYGVALRIWSKANDACVETIRKRWNITKANVNDNDEDTYWIPYSLSFLSKYPLYDLLGDYLRGLWIHCNKTPHLGPQEISYLLTLQAPRLNGLVRIEAKDYALCYQFPAFPSGFKNFAMWPLFSCLSIHNIISAVEAALSPTGRIIFTSQTPAMLTLASETLRKLVRVYEWSGLYIPVVHVRYVKSLVQEPGPYILGISAKSRTLYTAPDDAIIIDLDRNYVLNAKTLTVFTPAQRTKMGAKIAQALNHEVVPSGIPQHLRSAYINGKLVPSGQIIAKSREITSIQDPKWWNRDAILAVMDQICEKSVQNTGIRAIFGGSQKKPLMRKVSVKHLNELEHDRNRQIRDAQDAWQDLITFKGRMNTELGNVNKQNGVLIEELESWKQQFLKFQVVVENLSGEARVLKMKIETHKFENYRLKDAIEQSKTESAALAKRLASTEGQRDQFLRDFAIQQKLIKDLERQGHQNEIELTALQHHCTTVTDQRDNSLRVVLRLRDLIDSQTHQLKEIVHTINLDEVSESGQVEQKLDGQEILDSEDDFSSKIPTSDGKPIIPASRRYGQIMPAMHSGTKASSHNAPNQVANRDNIEATFMSAKDRHLRNKSKDMAEIVRQISRQCAAAVEELQLCQDAEQDAQAFTENWVESIQSNPSPIADSGFDFNFESSDGHFRPNRASPIPPAPCLSTTKSRSSSTCRSRSTNRSSFATTVDRSSSQCRDGIPDVLGHLSKGDDGENKSGLV